MRGTLRIFRTQGFEVSGIHNFLDMFLQDGGKIHLLLSDGIILDMRDIFSEDEMQYIFIQRVLTSHQLERILMDSDESPFFIAIRSDVISEWKPVALEGLYDILRIKALFRGCHIWMNIVGSSGVFEKYLGEWRFLQRREKYERGLYAWDGQHQQ
jgi:hypothetical protein